MPRIARRNIRSYYIHVIVQGIEKRYVFEKDEYKELYINLLYKKIKAYNNMEVMAYCVMDNHAHILMYCKEIENLSKLMSNVNTSYALAYNKLENRVGYVFRNRFYTQEIKDESHLFNSLAYIHRNPQKAKIVDKMGEYRYSSYNNYTNYKVKRKIIDLIFGEEDYMERFDYIHKNFREENIIDVKEKIISEFEIRKIMYDFCEKYNITIEYVRKNNYLLILLVNKIKKETDITNKEISEYLGIGKNRIRNILNREKINNKRD